MSGKMSESSYVKLVKENLEWLDKQPRTLEREHIRCIIECSVTQYYPGNGEEGALDKAVCTDCLAREET